MTAHWLCLSDQLLELQVLIPEVAPTLCSRQAQSVLASSPGLFFRLRNGRTETEARKKGLVSIARVTFDHSPESGESVHTRIFVCDISPYNHVKMALQEAYCLRCNL